AETEAWRGTAAELLAILTREPLPRNREWPTTGRVLANAIRRLSPDLRATGIEVEYCREAGTGRRLITIKRAESSVTSVTSVTRPARSGVPGDDGSDDGRAVTIERDSSPPRNPAPNRTCDDGDDCDDEFPPLSGSAVPGRDEEELEL